jgi:hypothetical protein
MAGCMSRTANPGEPLGVENGNATVLRTCNVQMPSILSIHKGQGLDFRRHADWDDT